MLLLMWCCCHSRKHEIRVSLDNFCIGDQSHCYSFSRITLTHHHTTIVLTSSPSSWWIRFDVLCSVNTTTTIWDKYGLREGELRYFCVYFSHKMFSVALSFYRIDTVHNTVPVAVASIIMFHLLLCLLTMPHFDITSDQALVTHTICDFTFFVTATFA